MGYTTYTDDTSSYTSPYIWIYRTSSSDDWYKTENKKEKEFIEENEFSI